MNHDPLCRRAQITEVFMEGCPECAFIAKVREDQSCKCKFWNGHAAGVQAARDAVAARAERFVNPETGEFYIVKSAALAAIDALKGDANG